MRVTFCWADISGYMAACWRALQAETDVDLTVIAPHPSEGRNIAFRPDLLDPVEHHLIPRGTLQSDGQTVVELVLKTQPDVLVISGWAFRAYREAAKRCSATGVRVIMGMDTAVQSVPRRVHRRVWSHRHFGRLDAVVVPGERGRRVAERLGFKKGDIYSGLYGVDVEKHSDALAKRRGVDWPRRFVYVGMLTERKGVDRLLDAFSLYREASPNGWSLTICGLGPLAQRARSMSDVDYRGFVDPRDLPGTFAEHGAFVLVSRHEPWGTALVEACAAGLPVICSEACGSSVEVARDFHNGRVLTTSGPREIAQAMQWLEAEAISLEEMGTNSAHLASAYSAGRWAARWRAMFDEVAFRPRCR